MKKVREVMFNPIEFSSMAKQGAFYWGLITPQLFVYLFAALFFCSQSVSKLIAVMSAEQVEESFEGGMLLNVRSASVADLNSVKKLMVYLEPEVEVKINESAEKPQLIISVTKAERYNRFREALVVVQGSLPDAIWTAEEICIGKCNGTAATATLTAITQTIQMKSTP